MAKKKMGYHFWSWNYKDEPNGNVLSVILEEINGPARCMSLDNGSYFLFVIYQPSYNLTGEEWLSIDSMSHQTDLTFAESSEELRKLIKDRDKEEEEEDNKIDNLAAQISELFSTGGMLEEQLSETSDLIRGLEKYEKDQVWEALDISNGEGWELDEIQALGHIFDVKQVAITIKSVAVERKLDGKQ
jgi:hypothetical protein